MLNLSDKVFWVTGSSRGIGSGVARHLAEHGASIVVHGRSTESLAPIIAELSNITQVLGIAADVRDEQSLILAVKQIEERLAEVATEKKEEPKVTAKEIKAKVRRPAAPKAVVETPAVEATEVKRKPTRRKPKAKKAE